MATAQRLVGIDWAQPWLAPYRAFGSAVEDELARGLSVAQALNEQLERAPIHLAQGRMSFISADAAASGEAYEAFIARTAQVPTRDNRHDLFNGLAWLAFPRLKRRLNELQAARIALDGVGARRGAVRDRLTLIDENGTLWQAPPVLVAALRERDWQALFVTHRAAWRRARTTLVGHALLDKLGAPRKAITAHAWVVPEGVDAEAWLAEALAGEPSGPGPHLPLPVLGIPGWWPDNQSEGFYRDATVFRPGRG